MSPPDMDEIYRRVPLEDIPWNIETPPATLMELVEGGKVEPCRAIDLGCGTGNYAVWLAGMGFDVTGVDISPTAINAARDNARRMGARCRFIVADAREDLEDIEPGFGFAYDWEMLHHIMPDDREKYAGYVHRLLSPGGKYLSVCFSEEDPGFGGVGKTRETQLGTVLYFSSEVEIRKLFSPIFNILDLRTIEVPGKPEPHPAVYAFMEK